MGKGRRQDNGSWMGDYVRLNGSQEESVGVQQSIDIWQWLKDARECLYALLSDVVRLRPRPSSRTATGPRRHRETCGASSIHTKVSGSVKLLQLGGVAEACIRHTSQYASSARSAAGLSWSRAVSQEIVYASSHHQLDQLSRAT